MPNTLTELLLLCHECGNTLWRYSRTTVDTSTGIETPSGQPDEVTCKKCKGQEYFQMLRSAHKINTLTKGK